MNFVHKYHSKKTKRVHGLQMSTILLGYFWFCATLGNDLQSQTDSISSQNLPEPFYSSLCNTKWRVRKWDHPSLLWFFNLFHTFKARWAFLYVIMSEKTNSTFRSCQNRGWKIVAHVKAQSTLREVQLDPVSITNTKRKKTSKIKYMNYNFFF